MRNCEFVLALFWVYLIIFLSVVSWRSLSLLCSKLKPFKTELLLDAVAPWDGIEVPQTVESSAMESVSIGYIGDEW